MLRLQRTTATCATTTATGNHENDEAKGSHVQASASTHTDMRLRDEYRAYHGRLVGVRQAAYPSAACGASAGARHPSRVTRFDSWCVQWSKSDRTKGETSARSRMRPGLHAVSLGRPIGTASKGQIFALSSNPSAHRQ